MGGGREGTGTDEKCIFRECLEEAGREAEAGQRVCSAEAYGNHYSSHPFIEYFHPMQARYPGKLVRQVRQPMEQDHALARVPYEELRGSLFVAMKN